MQTRLSWAEIFLTRLPHIYFIYGLAFFVLGLAIALEIGRGEPTRFRRAMWPLAFFGLIHGSHEWLEMFVITGRETYGFEPGFGLYSYHGIHQCYGTVGGRMGLQ